MSDETPTRLERLTDSTTAKMIRTYLVPALLSIALWLGAQVWDQVKSSGEATAQGIESLRGSVADIKQSVAVQAAVFGDKTKQIDQNTDRLQQQQNVISNHEARIQVLEADKGVRR